MTTTERRSSVVQQATASVTHLSAEDLKALPYTTVADLLRNAPGFAFVNADGSGSDPRVIVRGFYGGGEAEYVVVLVDGRPVNRLNAGVVAWNTLPSLESIESIDIVRGSSSALYGDAALGGVINITTRKAAGGTTAFAIEGGSDGAGRASFDARTAGSRGIGISGGFDRSDGYREHSATKVANLAVAAGNATFSGFYRDFLEPGPSFGELHTRSGVYSNPFYSADRTEEYGGRAALDHVWNPGSDRKVTVGFSGGFQHSDIIRTLQLSADFADTRKRVLNTRDLSAAAQYLMPVGGVGRLQVGIDAAVGRHSSTYQSTDFGSLPDPVAEPEAGVGNRVSTAPYFQLEMQPAQRVRLTAGSRLDYIRDKYVSGNPGVDATGPISHTAFSPKVGANFEYLRSENASGYVYAAASRSFKAATPDQLFDERPIPVPFPPYSISTSNSELKPQYGTSLEVGVYHDAMISGDARLSVSASAYSMQMKDELDFDVATFRYLNIGKSRHRGLESGVRVMTGAGHSAFANLTLQTATAQSGDHQGSQLKAVPKRGLEAGVSLAATPKLQVAIGVHHAGGIFIDDANQRELPAYTTVDLQLSRKLGGAVIWGGIRNAFDRKYDTGAFMDPGGSDVIFYYPASERQFSIGIRSGGGQ